MKYVIDEIVDAIEDFINDNQLAKGLKQGEVVRLKSAIDLLQTYEATLPDDILGAIRDILKFTMGLGSGKRKEGDEGDEDEKGKLKKAVHSWGFTLAPNDNDFEKEEGETRKRRRKKSGKVHNWGFSLSDQDIEKEDDSEGDEDDDDDED